jgi:hypothetical protein
LRSELNPIRIPIVTTVDMLSALPTSIIVANFLPQTGILAQFADMEADAAG